MPSKRCSKLWGELSRACKNLGLHGAATRKHFPKFSEYFYFFLFKAFTTESFYGCRRGWRLRTSSFGNFRWWTAGVGLGLVAKASPGKGMSDIQVLVYRCCFAMCLSFTMLWLFNTLSSAYHKWEQNKTPWLISDQYYLCHTFFIFTASINAVCMHGWWLSKRAQEEAQFSSQLCYFFCVILWKLFRSSLLPWSKIGGPCQHRKKKILKPKP